jgi:hypothetical protein
MPKSKVLADKSVLILAYNKLFSKWEKAKGVKKQQLKVELDNLDKQINS